jgi:hypothetical protein
MPAWHAQSVPLMPLLLFRPFTFRKDASKYGRPCLMCRPLAQAGKTTTSLSLCRPSSKPIGREAQPTLDHGRSIGSQSIDGAANSMEVSVHQGTSAVNY